MMVRAVLSAQVRGAKFRRSKTPEGMPVLDDDRFDLVQRRIASADVDKILLGHAMGREIAWVKKTRDQLRSSGDEKPASMLAEHYDLCVQAEKLLEQSIAKMPKATMELAVKELQDAGNVLPQSLQLAIFKRAVSELQNNLNDGNTELFMTTVLSLDNQRDWDRGSVRWLGTKVGREGANAT